MQIPPPNPWAARRFYETDRRTAIVELYAVHIRSVAGMREPSFEGRGRVGVSRNVCFYLVLGFQ